MTWLVMVMWLFLFILGYTQSLLLPAGLLYFWGVGTSLLALWFMGFSFLVLWSTALGAWVSEAVAHQLSCSVACGIFPSQGLNPCPLHWQADSYLAVNVFEKMWSQMALSLVSTAELSNEKVTRHFCMSYKLIIKVIFRGISKLFWSVIEWLELVYSESHPFEGKLPI